MRNTTSAVIMVWSLAACSATGKGNDADAATKHSSVGSYEVAGVSPGMTIDQATSVLRAEGFSIETRPGQSFENAVEDEIAKMHGKPLGIPSDYKGIESLAATKGDERIMTDGVIPSPGNGTILSLRYTVGLGTRSEAEIRSKVMQKYGPPSSGSGTEPLHWCAKSEGCDSRTNKKPILTYTGEGDQAALYIDSGSDVVNAARQPIKDAVARRIGKSATSF